MQKLGSAMSLTPREEIIRRIATLLAMQLKPDNS